MVTQQPEPQPDDEMRERDAANFSFDESPQGVEHARQCRLSNSLAKALASPHSASGGINTLRAHRCD